MKNNKLPGMNSGTEKINNKDLYSDIEFIKLFKQFNRENIAMICDMISSPEKERRPDSNTQKNLSEEFIANFVLLKNRLLKFSKCGGSNIILFNSPNDEGHSSKSMLLFTKLLVESNSPRILLVDSNLRSPNLHKFLNVQRNLSLSDYVFGNKSIDDIIIETELANVSLIAGGKVSNPINLLLSDRFLQLFELVKTQFDLVIIDSPPYRNYVDTFILSKFILPIVLLVIKNENSAWKNIKDIRTELAVLDIKLLGLIDNSI